MSEDIPRPNTSCEEDPCPDYCAVINKACDAGKHCTEGCVIEETRRQQQKAVDKAYKCFRPAFDIAMENFAMDFPEYEATMTIDYAKVAFLFKVTKKNHYRGLASIGHFITFEYLYMLRVPMDLYNELKNLKYRLDKEAK